MRNYLEKVRLYAEIKFISTITLIEISVTENVTDIFFALKPDLYGYNIVIEKNYIKLYNYNIY